MFTVFVFFYLNCTSGGGDEGGVRSNKAVKPITRVCVCVSRFVTVTPLYDFKETSRQFPAVLVVTKMVILSLNMMHNTVGRENMDN